MIVTFLPSYCRTRGEGRSESSLFRPADRTAGASSSTAIIAVTACSRGGALQLSSMGGIEKSATQSSETNLEESTGPRRHLHPEESSNRCFSRRLCFGCFSRTPPAWPCPMTT